MRISFKKTFYWSLSGHLLLVLGVVIASLITSCSRKRKPAPHVFTVHSTPAQPTEQKKSIATPKNETVVKKVIPEKKVEIPKPKPQELKPQTTPKKKTPIKKEKKIERPKTQSYEQFLKENKIKPKPTPPPVRHQSQPRKSDTFNDIKNQLNLMIKESSDTTSSNSENNKALQGYMNQLRRKLNLLWNQPDNLPPGEWIAHIEFRVSATGKITNIRFVKRSGDTAFDQSLIRAMNQFSSTSAPPDRKAHKFEIPFRIIVH